MLIAFCATSWAEIHLILITTLKYFLQIYVLPEIKLLFYYYNFRVCMLQSNQFFLVFVNLSELLRHDYDRGVV